MKITRSQAFFYILLAFAAYFGFKLLEPYLILVAMAFVIAVVFYPLYKKLLTVFRGNKSLATSFTVIVIYLTVVIPIGIIGTLVAAQVISLSNDIRNINDNIGGFSLEKAVTSVNERLDKVNLTEDRLTVTQVKDFARQAISPLGNVAVTNAVSIGNTAVNSIAIIIVFTMIVSGVLNNKDHILSTMRKASPLPDDIDRLYFKRLSDMSKAMVKGVFVVAFANSTVTAFFLWLVGVPYVVFWWLLAFFFSLFPLGAGVVSVPIGIFLILTGDLWQGVFLLVTYLVVVSNLDQVLRPRLVPKDAGVHPAMTVLSIFGGLKMFGFFGVILGPVLMIFILTTFQVYLQYYQDEK